MTACSKRGNCSRQFKNDTSISPFLEPEKAGNDQSNRSKDFPNANDPQDVGWISQTGQNISDKGPAHQDGSPVSHVRDPAHQCFERYERSGCPVENPRDVEHGTLLLRWQSSSKQGYWRLTLSAPLDRRLPPDFLVKPT